VTPSPTSFTFEPLFLALAAVAASLYWVAARRERPPGWRIACFAVGLFLVAASVNSPLETLAVDYLVLMHLLQNVAIADWAPPLLILGLTPAMRAAIARRGGRVLEVITRPRFALPIWLAGWYLIHLAAFYDTALRNPWLLNVEHLILLAIGLVFWWCVISDAPRPVSTGVRIAYLGAAFVASSFLGLAFTFSNSVFYDYYESVPRLWGLSASQDQNLGGVLMTGEQAIVFLVVISVFVIRLLKEEEAKERELDERLRQEGLKEPLRDGGSSAAGPGTRSHRSR
jgi:cytochrome c oxidase assembly factor CtaG